MTHRIHHALTIEELEPRIAPAAGDLDPTFGIGGIVTTDFLEGANNQAYGSAIQTDGKIVVVGSVSSGNRYDDFALGRYKSDGSLDATLDGDGKATTDFGGSQDSAHAVAIQADGKIVVAGYVWAGSDYDFAVVRHNSDGSLDTSFDGDGKVTTAFGNGWDRAYAVAIQGDGRIVVAGYASNDNNSDFALARYNRNGSLDTTFDGDGKVTTDFGGGYDVAYAVAIRGDGKIVVVGYAANGSNDDFALARYNTDGSLDTTFEGDGKVTTDFGGGRDYGSAVAIQSDGKIVVAGGGHRSSHYDFALARYNTDGSLDTTFGGDGKIITDFGGGPDHAHSVAIQEDGKIVAAGNVYFYFALARYDNNGSPDTTFGEGGKVITHVGSGGSSARAVAIQPDGKIVVAGPTYNGHDYDFALARYEGLNPDIVVTDSLLPVEDLHMPFAPVVADGMGGAVATATFAIRNDGQADLAVDGLTLDGGTHFQISGIPTTPFVIAPGHSVVGTVTFDPLEAGTLTDTIHITSDDPDEGVVDIALWGQAGYLVVLSAQDRLYRFHDADGDWIQLAYGGSGQAVVLVADGMDIISVRFSGTMDRSRLIVKDLDPRNGSPNTMTLGTVQTAAGESMGVLKLIDPLGAIADTGISIDGDLTKFIAIGDVQDVSLNVGGDTKKVFIRGSVTGSTMDIAGDAALLKTVGRLDGSTVHVGGDLAKVLLLGGMSDSGLAVGGDAAVVQVKGGMAAGSTVLVGGDASRAILSGPRGGGAVAAGCAVTFGSLSRALTVMGDLDGTIDIRGPCVSGGRNSRVKITGNLTGDLLADLFGNVMILGDFTGDIGDVGTAAGVGNLLRVGGPVVSGTVTPPDAFARYIGYP